MQKQLLPWLYGLLSILSIVSCNTEDPQPSPSAAKGNLTISVSLDSTMTQASSNARIAATLSQLQVKVYQVNGVLAAAFTDASTLPESVELEAAQYYIVVESNTKEPYGFGNPYYYGKIEGIEVQAEKTKATTITAAVQSVKVTLEYDAFVENYYKEYYTKIGTLQGVLTFEQGEEREGFFNIVEGEDITIETHLFDLSGKETIARSVIKGAKQGTYYPIGIAVETGGTATTLIIDETVNEKTALINVYQGHYETRPDYIQSSGFFVKNGRLYDMNGHDFVMRGINNPHYWFDSYGRYEAYKALPHIAAKGTNTVRLVWEAEWDDNQWEANIAQGDTEANMLRKIIQETINRGMIPMVELHDATGETSKESLVSMAAYWAREDISQVLKEYEGLLLVNIANEWSGFDQTYKSAYLEAIAMMRNAGLNHTIVIDGSSWGQDLNLILEYGQTFLDSDPQHNLLFSVHMYESWKSPDKVSSMLRQAVDAQLPLIVGEFGFQHGDPPAAVAWETILEVCEELQLGYLAWSWKGNGDPVSYLDLAVDWEGSQLTEWGKMIFESEKGISNTAKPASVFTVL
ncbi:cellulase family glycosylhydrolase [Limibacter armeniacum]|uniref:cellulase family glycosylhydrolase n=1 Tax=Limibacter armeniacum TaxID=466084 RepID=UPI002FE58EA5